MTKTILLADDSLTIQKVVELTFADTQYNVVSLSSGDELLEKLEDVQPELVICDIIMPGLEGYDVCQQIKSNPATLHIPVILLSGTFEPFDRDRAVAAGCSEIITKPFEAKRLVDAVEKLLSPAGAEPAHDDSQPESFGFGDASQDEDPSAPAVDFGTRLTPSDQLEEADQGGEAESEDGIDFTTSGFAEMEAAAQAVEGPSVDTTSRSVDLAQEPGEGFTETGPDDDLATTGDEDFADAFSTDASSFEPQAPETQAVGADPFGTAEEPPEAEVSQPDVDGPFADTFDGVDEDLFEGTGPALDSTLQDPSPEPDFEVKSAEEAFESDPGPVFLTDADTAPVPSVPEDDADSEQPVQAEDEETAEPPTPADGLTLSDEDVERIARKMIELSNDRVEQIAWEVIPDIAEVTVRERIRQLEAEFETEN